MTCKKILALVLSITLMGGTSAIKTVNVVAAQKGPAIANSAGTKVTSGTIQEAIDKATVGDTIIVPAGIYNEQLVISKDIALKGTGDVVIAGPEDYSKFKSIPKIDAESLDYSGLIMVQNNANVSITGITIKGDPLKASKVSALTHGNRYAGLILVNANAILKNVNIFDMTFTDDLKGMQGGFGIYAATTGSNTLTVTNSEISNFNKAAFIIRAGYTTNITNSLIVGNGDQGVIAQNGIQFASKAIIKNNTIKDLIYNPSPSNQWANGSVAIYPVNYTPEAGDIDRNIIDNVDNVIADKGNLASKTTHIVYPSQSYRLQEILDYSPSDTTVKLQAGTYYNSTGIVPSVPQGIKLITNDAKFFKADRVISSVAELTDAILNQADGQIWVIKAGKYDLPSQLLITKPITIKGSGEVIITPSANFNLGTYSADKNLISINGVKGLVRLENLTISNAKRNGINVFESANVVLKNIVSKDSAAAGLVVNNSVVVADNLNTSGNAWGYGVNVDNGSNPGPGAPATFFTLNSGIISEAKQIVSDKGGVTIVAPNYSVFINDASKVFGATITSWYGDGNAYLDTSVNFNFDNIKVSDIDSIKFSLYQNGQLLGTRFSTGRNLVNLLKDCANYWNQTADTYTMVTGIRTMSAAFMNRDAESDNGFWVSSACTATNASVPNGLVVEVKVDNVTYISTK